MTEQFITGDGLKAFADFNYSPLVKSSDDYDNLVGTLDLSLVEDYTIIYTHTFYAKQLFECIQYLNKKIIVITHNGDNMVDSSYMIPDNVIKWYAIMIDTINPRLEAIPIGIANDRYFPWLNRREVMASKLEEPRNYRKLAYMNFDIRTNPAKRTPVYYQFKDQSWVTMRMGVNTVDFPDFIDNVYNHKFVICPDGNGLGSHRTWESLYLGAIPIEKKNLNNQHFTDLPILLVDEWEQVTEDFLEKKWDEMQGQTWNMDKLYLDYWRKRITGK